MRTLLCLLLPAVVFGKIVVIVNLSTNPPIYDLHGHSSTPVTDELRKEFKIEDEELKQVVANYTKQKPAKLIFNKNTSFGDVYEKYGWYELKTVVNAKVKAVEKEVRTSNPWKTSKGYISALNTYEDDTKILNENVSYVIEHDFGVLAFESTWGVPSKYQNKFSVDFAPTNLTKYEANAVIEYEAKLYGDVVVYYETEREGHHIWAYDIRELQNKGGLPKTVVKTETVKITYAKPIVIANSTTPKPELTLKNKNL